MKKPFNTGHTEQPLADEQALLEHYRQHSLAQPSAAMDARILAAAAAELNRARPAALPWSQRLHGWLFGPGHRVRWSVAFASLASIGLGLGLSLRTWQALPPAYELGEPLPAMSAAPAPASAPLVPPMVEVMELKKPAEPVRSAPLASAPSPVLAQDKASRYGKAESAPVLGELKANSSAVAKQRAADAPTAGLADSAAKADKDAERVKAKAAPTLEQALQALLQLQRSGATQAATAEFEHLQRLYPEHDLAAELAKLRASQP